MITAPAISGSTTPRPVALAPILDNLPPELKRRKQWVGWTYANENGRWTKVPVRASDWHRERPPLTDGGPRKASPKFDDTWATYGIAEVFLKHHPDCGIGFVLHPNDPYTGVDLDDCLDPLTGELTPEAAALVAELNTYTDISPSAKGLKAIARGRKPGPRCHGILPSWNGGAATQAVEMYNGQFFTLTGHRYPGTPASIEERQAALDRLYAACWPEPVRPQAVRPILSGDRSGADLSDREIVERAGRAPESGDRFRSLWGGDASAAQPRSKPSSKHEADYSLLKLLAYWTGDDPARLERIFAGSGLGGREKWRTRPDYRKSTIAAAITAQAGHFWSGDEDRRRRAERAAKRAAAVNALGLPGEEGVQLCSPPT